MNNFTWKEEFHSKMYESKIPDGWDLCIDMNLGKKNKGQPIYTPYTFGSFKCSHCLRSWNSSKVFLLFVMNLNKRQKCGTVRMRIFKQYCEKCNYPVGEYPRITSENIARVVYNLVHKIQIKCYGRNDKNKDLKAQNYGTLDGPHNREHCEACRLGLCERQMQSGEDSTALGVFSAIALGVGTLALMYLSSK